MLLVIRLYRSLDVRNECPRSETTRSRSTRHALLELIETIDEVGKEIKLLDESLP